MGKQGCCCTEISPVVPARPSRKRKLVARYGVGENEGDLKKNKKILFCPILFEI
jgi:hypothetical protein